MVKTSSESAYTNALYDHPITLSDDEITKSKHCAVAHRLVLVLVDEVRLIRPTESRNGKFAAGYTLTENLPSVDDVASQMLISVHDMVAFRDLISGCAKVSSERKKAD